MPHVPPLPPPPVTVSNASQTDDATETPGTHVPPSTSIDPHGSTGDAITVHITSLGRDRRLPSSRQSVANAAWGLLEVIIDLCTAIFNLALALVSYIHGNVLGTER